MSPPRDDPRKDAPGADVPRFYFGAMSPYSWFAAERIDSLLPQARWHGVFAGAVFKQNDRVSWGLTDEREKKLADCEARAAEQGLGPIRWPDPWPTVDLLVARAMIFCMQEGEDDALLRAFALAAMRLSFLEGVDIGEAEAVLEAGRRAGIEGPALAAALQDQGIKDALRADTDAVVAAGVFGVPTVSVGGELFWGDDRLEDAARAYRA
ncbi:MAG TPA: DsbA family protein [Solirubrobacteraceae bacterium]|nr:DsbA family protein [Solirubrobacteraceae bacterium]